MSSRNTLLVSTVASGITLLHLSTNSVSSYAFCKFDTFKPNHILVLVTPVCFLGHRADFLLPDRSKYVDMEKRFLHSYMDLLVQTCHRRGALATGGMAALLLPRDKESDLYKTVLATVTRQDANNSSMVMVI